MSVLSDACGALEVLSKDSSSRLYVPIAALVVSISTRADDALFEIVTNSSETPLFCLSSIVGTVYSIIDEEISSITSVAEFPLIIVMDFAIDVERINSYT